MNNTETQQVLDALKRSEVLDAMKRSEVLDALKRSDANLNSPHMWYEYVRNAIAICEASLARVVEPVAWANDELDSVITNDEKQTNAIQFSQRHLDRHNRPLYATPQEAAAQPSQAVEFSDVEIRRWWARENGLEDVDMCKLDDFTKTVRAVIAAINAKVTK